MEWRVCKIDDFSAQDLARCLALAEPARRAQLQSFRHPARQKEALCGEWLTKTMLAENSGIPLDQLQLLRDPKGKPYAANCPLYFNISHSGEYIACAVSSNPIGIDIEANRQPDLRVARRLCTAQDFAYLAPEKPDVARRFLQIWTAKEAYFKCLGTGITGLQSISLFDLQPRLQQIQTNEYILSIYQ